jgi:ATP-dependent DNA ligase
MRNATEEIKLDGYRAQAINSDGKLILFSRRRKSFNWQFPLIVEALGDLPENTVIDGEVVALDESGRPDFNMLQNFRSAASRMHYFVFDLFVYEGRDLKRLPLIERREIMRSVLKFSSPRIRISDYVEASATHMLDAVRQQGLEGIIREKKRQPIRARKAERHLD